MQQPALVLPRLDRVLIACQPVDDCDADAGLPDAVAQYINLPAGGSIDAPPSPSHFLAMPGSSDSPSAAAKARPVRMRSKASAVLERPPLLGWRTTDEDEIALRRWRGRTEIFAVEPIEPAQPAVFGTFRVRSGSGAAYEVEIRSLTSFTNSCDCLDYRANGLGTCKHIEGVLVALRQRGSLAFRVAAARGSARIEVFLDRRGSATPSLTWPSTDRRAARAARRFLAPFLDPSGTLTHDPARIEALMSAWHVAPVAVRQQVRVSRHFAPWFDRLRRERSRKQARAAFLAEVRNGAASFDLLRCPLLPYQREGMLHLVFGERA
jgi:hypothetical protein